MSGRILVVEDNEKNRKIIRLFFEGEYELVFAENGKEGIDMAKAEMPDLILMDLSLPIIDGWEATRILKADQKASHIPIIALTAHAMAGDREGALEAGCDDFVTKPVNFELLKEKIEFFLRTEAA